ncbi:MAG: aminotransferase [Ignavibacteria bacterium GWB2_35_12]|nr:MAG: aminotransferase [Ignavibacteria bacterium GWA2_35_8]OGU39711.1 MAG: aminotransferase [Ignavibacteria bacterium GWB2_35_12]OGU93164.1 MAG: aminotransferase [Ignavibacteria bacterium RIFOXYA2_FULL_35_10]OGV23906.1 MAG: aminotransferase [Ignavibacteria bacterium RIFOXYC2_FULL_35_21]
MGKEIRKDTPINFEIVKKNIGIYDAKNISLGNTRIVSKIVDNIESETGEKFIRMEMGVPGISPSEIGINAEINALKNNVAGIYPPVDGHSFLKKEMSRFVKLFLNIEVKPENCFPTVGSINGSYASFMVAGRRIKEKNTILFIDPGFPPHKKIVRMLGLQQESFDVNNYRGKELKDKLTEKLNKGNIAALLYSNPNNPTWICFTDEELKIISDIARENNIIVIEDLAYLGMDFRKDYSHPGQPPYQPTIANYMDNYILLISGSKAFSYAGQRIGMLIISENLSKSHFKDLLDYYTSDIFSNALIYETIFLTTAGVAQSVQYGFSEILRAANDGKYNFVDDVRVYGEKAEIMKKIFTDNGFKIVYDMDGDVPIADGFYFTVSFPGFHGDELSEKLLYYGISSIPLSSTGSLRTEGIRACVSLVQKVQMPQLEKRLNVFYGHYKENIIE